MAAFNGIKLFCLMKLTLRSVKVLPSPNSPILFDIVFWGETNRSNLSQMFFKVNVLKNFANFFAGLRKTPTQVFFCKICEIFKNTYGGCFWANTGSICGSLCGEESFWSFCTRLPWLSNIMLNWVTKSCFDISLLFKLKYPAILVLSYIVDCE